MIHLTNDQRRIGIPETRVRRLARQILGSRSLSIAFVTDRTIRKINRRFLKHDFATDVLSFPLGGDPWGEVVISAEYAAREAKARGIPLEEEILRYVAHGILHLLGYDDHDPRERVRMWRRQERELGKVIRIRKGPDVAR
jgi:probable rRNA maturation factor